MSWWITLGEILALLVAWVLVFGPAYVMCDRRGTGEAWVAFIPFVGVWIALLRSVGTTGWWTLITLVPLGGLGLALWLAFNIPHRHGRSGWWTAAFVFVPIVSWWAYALTLFDTRHPELVV